MEPQSLPRDYAQMQNEAQGTWQGPVCLAPPAASMLCIAWHGGDNKYLLSPFQTSQALSLCLLGHRQSPLKGPFPFF